MSLLPQTLWEQTHHSLVELHQLRAAAEDPGDAEGVEPLHLAQVQHCQGGVVGDGGADGTSPRPGSSGLCSNSAASAQCTLWTGWPCSGSGTAT